MIEVHVKCPTCGKSLMDGKHRIDNLPSIAVEVAYAGKKGSLHLSSLYGSYHIDIEVPCPEGKVSNFFCPHCKGELKASRMCEVCEAPMVGFSLLEGGKIQICSRRGCKKHLVEFEDPEQELRMFYETYGTFFKAH
ncbi:MAG: hypothetical protein HY924_02735 [Elusimicrobia bacterium]|nr:hypothetical protein [Elusimicrobiota bacterium]